MKRRIGKQAAAFILALGIVSGIPPTHIGGLLQTENTVVQAANTGAAVDVDSEGELLSMFQNGGMCRLTSDITLSGYLNIPNGEETQLDLNGHILTLNDELSIEGSLTISDSMSFRHPDGELYSGYGYISVKKNKGFRLNETGVMTLNSGRIFRTGSVFPLISDDDSDSSAKFVLNNGFIEDDLNDMLPLGLINMNGTVEIHGGFIKSLFDTVNITPTGTLIMTGGTIETTSDVQDTTALYVYGKAEISGGAIRSVDLRRKAVVREETESDYPAELTVRGGSIDHIIVAQGDGSSKPNLTIGGNAEINTITLGQNRFNKNYGVGSVTITGGTIETLEQYSENTPFDNVLVNGGRIDYIDLLNLTTGSVTFRRGSAGIASLRKIERGHFSFGNNINDPDQPDVNYFRTDSYNSKANIPIPANILPDYVPVILLDSYSGQWTIDGVTVKLTAEMDQYASYNGSAVPLIKNMKFQCTGPDGNMTDTDAYTTYHDGFVHNYLPGIVVVTMPISSVSDADWWKSDTLSLTDVNKNPQNWHDYGYSKLRIEKADTKLSTEPGTANIAPPNYLSISAALNPHKLSESMNGDLPEVVMDQTSVVYDGTAHTPSNVKLYYGDMCADTSTDFTPQTDAGNYYFNITGHNNYRGKQKACFTIEPKDISSVDTDISYNGSPRTPFVSVTDPAIKDEEGQPSVLQENKDYRIEYSDNTNAGSATVTITGIGNYTGTKTVSFDVGNQLADGEYKQTASRIDPETGDTTYYTRFVFVVPRAQFAGKSKTKFTATYNGTDYPFETNKYYTEMISNGVTYVPADENSVLFVVTVSSGSDISADLTCTLDFE